MSRLFVQNSPCFTQTVTSFSYARTMTTTTPDSTEHIHILGIGNIGKLFAHALSNVPTKTPVTLLLHREGLLEEWKAARETVTLIQAGIPRSGGNISIETTYSPSSPSSQISNIIVCTKAAKTAEALASIKHRLGPSSTILFAQNGMGSVEEVTTKVFPDEQARPALLGSINSHGIFTNGAFESTYAGKGFLAMGSLLAYPCSRMNGDLSVQSGMVRAILETPLLHSRVVPPEEFLPLQLEKLTVNSIMNPLTAIFSLRNGLLFQSPQISALALALLEEISAVIRALPELQGQEGIEKRFGVEALRSVVWDMAAKTADNTSSMLQDVRAGRETEIEYINGYICRRGRELGVKVERNEKLKEMVKGRVTIKVEDIEKWFGKGIVEDSQDP